MKCRARKGFVLDKLALRRQARAETLELVLLGLSIMNETYAHTGAETVAIQRLFALGT